MPRMLTKKQFKQMPWKNGAGTTTEIYRIDVKGQLIFRLSAAQITSNGSFSLYPGIDRTLSLLEGPGFKLISAESEILINDFLITHSFPGETPIECKLQGKACLDFNTMVDRGYGRVEIEKRIIEANDSYSYINKKDPTFIFIYPQENLYMLQPKEVFSTDISKRSQIIEVTLVIK